MSGILNKKERIFDFVLTENGRKQIQNNDIRYKYASISDSSILYTRNEELSIDKKRDIDNSIETNLFLETSTKVNNEINAEFSLQDFLTYEIEENVSFQDAFLENKNNLSLGESIKNLSLLTTKSYLNESVKFELRDNNYLNNDFNFENKIQNYPTIASYNLHKKNNPTIVFDEKFKDKLNYKIMLPEDSQGNQLYDLDIFSSDEISVVNLQNTFKHKYLFKNYNFSNNKNFKTSMSSSKDQIIRSTINDLEERSDIHKKIYEIKNPKDDEDFLLEMFETNDQDFIKKLHFIKIHDLVDFKTGDVKKIYQAGFIINTRNDDSDLKTVFNYKISRENLELNKTFAISAFYSFVSLFTIVIE